MPRHIDLLLAVSVTLALTGCNTGQGGARAASPEVIGRGFPVGVAALDTKIAIADTRNNVVLVEENGERIARIPALSNAFDTSGLGGELLLFSKGGAELAWVEYPGDTAVLRVLDFAKGQVSETDVGLPAIPRIAQLLWNDGYLLVSQSGARSLVTADSTVVERPGLPFGARVVVVDGMEWQLQNTPTAIELSREEGGVPLRLPAGGALIDAKAEGGRLAIVTTGQRAASGGRALRDKLFVFNLGEQGLELVASVAFEGSSEGPYRLAWTQSHLLVLMAEGEVRAYAIDDWRMSYSLDVGVPNAGGMVVVDDTVLVRTANDVRRIKLPVH